MRILRAREWVGIGLFAVALMVAFTFLDPAGGSVSVPMRPTVDPNVPQPTPIGITMTAEPTAPPQPTATPVTVDIPAATLTSWDVWFYELEDGERTGDELVYTETLDYEFTGPPTGDMVDDSWGLEAGTVVDVGAGRYRFRLEYSGKVTVFVDDIQVAKADGGGMLEVSFDHSPGQARVVIVAEDVEGLFRVAIR